MQHSRTLTLGDAMEAAERDAPFEGFADTDQRMQVLWQFCHTIGQAHQRGIVHGAIEAQRLLVGEYGDSLVIDWPHHGASPATDGCWLSPEQARGEAATARSDVYALGSALFHVLAGRPPLHRGTPDDLERRRRLGEYDDLEYHERARFSVALRAVVAKALSSKPEDRYESADALAEDIALSLSGFATRAEPERAAVRIRRFHARRWPTLWAMVALTVCVLTLAWAVWGQKVEDLAAWGTPIATESFADDRWTDRWMTIEGGFEIRDGRAVTVAPQSSILLYQRFLSGPTAIEYEAEMLPGSPPCDLSLIWSREIDSQATGRARLVQPITVQFGAYDGSYTAIMDHQDALLAHSPIKPEPGKRHRIRVEIIDDRMTVSIDGEQRCSYRDSFPLVGGYFALYGYYPGKAFGKVQVFSLGVPSSLPPTATGDALAQRGFFLEAASDYARVAASARDARVVEIARYKQGLCLYRAGRHAEAANAWKPLENGRYRHYLALYTCERRIADGDRLGALPALKHLAQVDDPDLHAQVVGLWSSTVSELIAAKTPATRRELPGWLEFRDHALPTSMLADRMSAKALLFLGRYDDLLARFPGERHFCARALVYSGRLGEVIESYADQRIIYADALMRSGSFARLLAEVPEFYNANQVALAEARYDDIPDDAGVVAAEAAILLGQPDLARIRAPESRRIADLLREHGLAAGAAATEAGNTVRARLAAGEPDLALSNATSEWSAQDAREVLAVRAIAAGDATTASRLFTELDGLLYRDLLGSFNFVIRPALEEFSGQSGAVVKVCEALIERTPLVKEQRPRHRALFLLGRIDDEAFLAQPRQQTAAADLLFLTGLRADLAGNQREAVQAYTAWQALPSWQRGLERHFAEEELVRWRLQVLAKPE